MSGRSLRGDLGLHGQSMRRNAKMREREKESEREREREIQFDVIIQ